MKTLKQITLTSLMIVLLTQVSFGNNFRKFRLHLSRETSVEVFSKVESLVEENLPLIHNIIKKDNPVINSRLILPTKEEELIQEDLVGTEENVTTLDERCLMNLVREMQQPEEEVDDLDFDTHEVFENYQQNHRYTLSAEELSAFIKEEKTVEEANSFTSLMDRVAK